MVLHDEGGPVDAILLTHDHHADAGRRLLVNSGAPTVTTEAAARRLGPPAHGMATPWAMMTLHHADSPTITRDSDPCRHGPPGTHPIVGDVVGFGLRWDGQHHGQLWITGDTVLYDALRQVPARLDPGTALVYLGGVRFPITGPLRYTMTADDAIELLAGTRASTIVPVHYEGWSHFHGDEESIRTAFAAAHLAERVRWSTPGEPLVIDC